MVNRVRFRTIHYFIMRKDTKYLSTNSPYTLVRRGTPGVGTNQMSESESESESLAERIASVLLAVPRAIVVAIAWVLSVVLVAFQLLWNAVRGDPERPDDEG